MDDIAKRVGEALMAREAKLVTAESCTGGWIAKRLTDIPGSSRWLDCGFVTYSNASKQRQLGVAAQILSDHGSVSEQTVTAMAQGALACSDGQIAVAVTGVAGPDGGSDDKPVGTVWFAWAREDGQTASQRRRFSGDRENVRRASVRAALEGILIIAERP